MDSAAEPAKLEPSVIVIFGITGDLAKRKVLPSLYHLFKDGLFDENTIILGTSRRELSVDELLGQVELCVLEKDNVCDPDVLKAMRERCRMLTFDPVNATEYSKLVTQLDELEEQAGVCLNRLFYLSIPPNIYGPIVANLGAAGLNKSCRHGTAASRLLVEKPFGYDLQSAIDLVEETNRAFQEDQIYRIDHYLAKETAQNILTFRAHNPIFADNWDGKHVHDIRVLAYEQIGIEGRVDFYERVGALRDIVQSHLLQLLALVTMELPADLRDPVSVRRNRQELLEQVMPPPPDVIDKNVRRMQYDTYIQEVDNPDSRVETFVALTTALANERWGELPVHLVTGKSLAVKRTEISLRFEGSGDKENLLTFRIQPNEGIDIRLWAKKPGLSRAIEQVKMDFRYNDAFANEPAHPDAYERVLVDAIRGDQTLFASGAEVLASWRILQPVLDAWAKEPGALKTYAAGSDGDTLAGF